MMKTTLDCVIEAYRAALTNPNNNINENDEFTYQKLCQIFSHLMNFDKLYPHAKKVLNEVYTTNTNLISAFNGYINKHYAYESTNKGDLIHVINLSAELFDDIKMVDKAMHETKLQTYVKLLHNAKVSLEHTKTMTDQEISDGDHCIKVIDDLLAKLPTTKYKMPALKSHLVIVNHPDIATWEHIEVPTMGSTLEYLIAKNKASTMSQVNASNVVNI